MPTCLRWFLCLLALNLGHVLGITSSAKAQNQTYGVFTLEPEASPGYVLFAPMSGTTTYLIDNYGRVVHSWAGTERPNYSVYLLPDGNLLRAVNPSGFELLAWDGTPLWDFRYEGYNYITHHDVEPLPNGNILVLAQEQKTNAEALAAGRDPSTLTQELRLDFIVEVRQTGPFTGEVVWEWHLWDHLVQDYDPDLPNAGVVREHPELLDINFIENIYSDWTHSNSVDYRHDLDQIIVTCRNLNEIWIIDHSTTTRGAAGHTGGDRGRGGDFLYRWGNPEVYQAGTEDDRMLFMQHHAHWIKSGLPGENNILLFNNGVGRPDGEYSTVDEIVPPSDGAGHYPTPAPGTAFGPDEPVWSIGKNPPVRFSSVHISGAQRLPNGNTLICSGGEGRFMEVTMAGDLVWEYHNPVTNGVPAHQCDVPTVATVFRCTRYAPDYRGLEGKILTPDRPIETYPFIVASAMHSPANPTNLDEVTVTVRIQSGFGINLAQLNIDIGDGFASRLLYDDGTHGDALAGDNIFTAIIEPQPIGTSVEYHIYAVDNAVQAVKDPVGAPVVTYGYTVEEASLDHFDLTLIEQQTNHPVITAVPLPSPEASWTWTVSDLDGFAGSPQVWFAYPDGDPGESNENHRSAELHWADFDPEDWATGVDGAFTLTLSDGAAETVVCAMQLSLRQLIGTGYFVFSHQTNGGSALNAPGAEGFEITVDQFDWTPGSTPVNSSLTLDEMGQVTDFAFRGSMWSEDGTCRLILKDGRRPASYVPGSTLSLRQILPGFLSVANDGEAGKTTVEVLGDDGPWDWSNFDDGLDETNLTAPDMDSASALEITWEAGDLIAEESGLASITIRPSSGTVPYSVITFPTVVLSIASCCEDRVGDVNGSGEDEPTIGDVSVLIDALFLGADWSVVPCLAEADINLSGGEEPTEADITIGDVSYLIDYLFITGNELGLPDCP